MLSQLTGRYAVLFIAVVVINPDGVMLNRICFSFSDHLTTFGITDIVRITIRQMTDCSNTTRMHAYSLGINVIKIRSHVQAKVYGWFTAVCYKVTLVNTIAL
ncbi:hypothetical protein D3C73_1396360 [compost metagenome]